VKKAEAEYLGKLVRLGCIACRYATEEVGCGSYDPPDPSLQMTVVHHPREGQGGAQRAQNWLGIPLCVAHHTGRSGIHQNGNKLPQYKLDEMDLLAMTIELYHRTYS
jgi:hypothetical protein